MTLARVTPFAVAAALARARAWGRRAAALLEGRPEHESEGEGPMAAERYCDVCGERIAGHGRRKYCTPCAHAVNDVRASLAHYDYAPTEDGIRLAALRIRLRRMTEQKGGVRHA